MPDGIKQIRMSEIQEMEQRISTFQQTAYTDLQKKQQDMVNPVIEKWEKPLPMLLSKIITPIFSI